MDDNIIDVRRHKFKKIKGQFVKVPHVLLKWWSPWMERQCKGSSMAYIQMFTFINRDRNNPFFGYAYRTHKELKRRMAIKSDKKIWQIMKFFVSIHFLDRKKSGRKYYYRVNEVPEPTKEVLELHDELKRLRVAEREQQFERVKAIREAMPIDEDFLYGKTK